MMLDETFIEMERGAKALDLHDVNTAAVCLRKAMEGHQNVAAPVATPPAQAVGPLDEIAKAINALEIKDFSLAALCCEKAAAAAQGRLPEAVTSALHMLGRAVRRPDLATAAGHLRAIIREYRPDMTLPAPAQTPGLASDSGLDDAPGMVAPASAVLPAQTPIIEPELMPKF